MRRCGSPYIRIQFVAVDIPKSFPVKDIREILDFDLTDISGKQYVVALAVRLVPHYGRESAQNEIEFRNYRNTERIHPPGAASYEK
jgi:hypothetical protein